MKHFFVAILLLVCGISSAPAQDNSLQGNQELLVVGFAFSGDFDKRVSRFPYTLAIATDLEKSNNSISRQIFNRLGTVNNSTLHVVGGKLFSTKDTESPLNGVMVLTGETVLVENYGSYWKAFINLRGDALIFDYKKRSVVKTYPLNLAIFDAIEGAAKPTDASITALIKENILTEKKEGLISQFLAKLSQAKIGNKSGKIFQIGEISVAPDVLAQFPEELSAKPDVVNDILADSFSSALAGQTNVSLMPQKVNGVVASMSIQLEDASDQIDLKIGEGDYLFKVALNKLIKVEKQRTASEVSNLYGASVSIQLIEPMLSKVLLDSSFKNGAISISPVNKVTTDDFPAYFDSISGLFRKFALAIGTNDLTWVKAAAGSDKAAEQITSVEKLIDKKGI